MERSLLDNMKLAAMRALAASVAQLPGSTAEVGVYRGGTTRLIASVLSPKRHWGFDTWAGIPSTTAIDGHRVGDFADVAFADVSAWLADCPNVVLVRGVFPDSARHIEDEFCFVHLDADTYSKTLDSLCYFYPRMTPGGLIVFDDWEWPQCPGVKRAADVFFEHRPERPKPTINNQAVVRIGDSHD